MPVLVLPLAMFDTPYTQRVTRPNFCFRTKRGWDNHARGNITQTRLGVVCVEAIEVDLPVRLMKTGSEILETRLWLLKIFPSSQMTFNTCYGLWSKLRANRASFGPNSGSPEESKKVCTRQLPLHKD